VFCTYSFQASPPRGLTMFLRSDILVEKFCTRSKNVALFHPKALLHCCTAALIETRASIKTKRAFIRSVWPREWRSSSGEAGRTLRGEPCQLPNGLARLACRRPVTFSSTSSSSRRPFGRSSAFPLSILLAFRARPYLDLVNDLASIC
jgi:hypothetical protein